MATKTKWTPEMVSRLHELRDRNWTVLEIAQEMGLPFEVVQGRINREKSGKLDAAEAVKPDAPPFSGMEFQEQELTDELLTKAEAWAIADFIEFWILDAIRKSEGLNSVWLFNLVRAFDKLCNYSGYKTGGYVIEKEKQNAE